MQPFSNSSELLTLA